MPKTATKRIEREKKDKYWNEKQLARDFFGGLNDVVGRGGIAGLVGAPGDIANMAENGLRALIGKPQVSAWGGSEHIGQKLQDAGLVSDVRRPKTELLASLISPASAAKTVLNAPKTARLALKALDNLDAPRTMANYGQRGAVDAGLLGKMVAPQDEALRVAQANAAKPVSEGGLGLRPDNTPEERAAAMGFEGGWFHGTTHDFPKFANKGLNKEGHLGGAHYLTNNPVDASENYAGLGPDLTQRISLEAERILNNKNIDWSGSSDPNYLAAVDAAKRKIAGGSDGHILPVMVRTKNPLDISPDSNQWIDFAPKYDRDGEIVADNKNVLKMFRELEKRGIDPADATQNLELYDEVRAHDLDQGLRASEGIMYAEDPRTGSLIGNDVIRRLYGALGYDGVKMDAKAAFPNMGNIPYGTKHLIIDKPNQIRSRFAAFDPMRRDSSDLLAGLAPIGLGALIAQPKEKKKP